MPAGQRPPLMAAVETSEKAGSAALAMDLDRCPSALSFESQKCSSATKCASRRHPYWRTESPGGRQTCPPGCDRTAPRLAARPLPAFVFCPALGFAATARLGCVKWFLLSPRESDERSMPEWREPNVWHQRRA